MFRLLFAAVAAAALALSPVPGRANAETTDATGVYKQTLPSVALVVGEVKDGVALGTAWVVDRQNRLVVTNHHVVAKSKNIRVYFPAEKNGRTVAEIEWYAKNGTAIPAKVVASEARKDIAVLQLEELPGSAKELKLAAGGAEPGSEVHAVGNPGTGPALWIYAASSVRAVYRFKEAGLDARVVETGLAMDQGASGSPVVNAAGEVVGMIFAYSTRGRLVTLSIDVSEVKVMVEEAKTGLKDDDARGRRSRVDD